MEKEQKIVLNEKTIAFITQFMSQYQESAKYLIRSGNEKTINTALIYEKLRVAVEYQEEHLIFKNAISRIVRRKYTLLPSITADRLLNDLVSELSWADYVNPETIEDKTWERIKSVIERYLYLLKYSRSGRFNKADLQKMIINWLACEIDDVMKPKKENDLLVDYTYGILKKGLSTDGTRLSDNENEIELRVTIFSLLLKPDLALIQYWLLKQVYPAWAKFTKDDLKKFGRSFDPYYNKIDRYINHPFKPRYIQYVKKNIAPFIVLRTTLIADGIDPNKMVAEPARLHSAAMETYKTMVEAVRKKVVGATIRALMFIFITKITLAFIIEIPFDRLIAGAINYLSLTVNIALPPLLMFISGAFTKSPPVKNYNVISSAITSIIFENKIEDKVFPLLPQKPPQSYYAFNLFYGLLSVGVLIGVLRLLILLEFNIISISLFFLFVSIVSFFSFRIRNIALELAMKRSRDDALTSAVELIFLPFIRIGKYLSGQFANFNPFILFLDFLIEAPLKTIIRIMNSWFKFINTKKEEIEF